MKKKSLQLPTKLCNALHLYSCKKYRVSDLTLYMPLNLSYMIQILYVLNIWKWLWGKNKLLENNNTSSNQGNWTWFCVILIKQVFCRLFTSFIKSKFYFLSCKIKTALEGIISPHWFYQGLYQYLIFLSESLSCKILQIFYTDLLSRSYESS